ncbi:MAG: 50S ribosomal protein L22 [Patescibacteria group bacterium]
MLLIKAEQRHSRQSPRKVRLAADAVRGMKLNKAIEQLSVIETKGSVVILKVIRQALANATNNLGLKTADLELKEITINQGSSFKRFRAASRGRSSTILKPTCHVKVILQSSVEPTLKPADKKTSKKVESKKEVKVQKEDKHNLSKVTQPEIHQANVENSMMDKSQMAKQVNRPMPARLPPTKKTVNRTTSK